MDRTEDQNGRPKMRQLSMDLYLKEQQVKYCRASRKDKAKILNEFCSLTGYGRKYAIHILRYKTTSSSKTKPCGRKKVYKPQELLPVLKTIWFACDQMCGKRLKAILSLWLPYYEKSFGMLEESIKKQLLSISSATLDRILSNLREKYPKRLCGTKPGTLLKQHIPIKTDQWNEKVPGYVEGDTVAHCGTSLSGDFVWSLTVTDICSGWTENRGTWNKGAFGVLEQIKSIESCLPFAILGWDSDNGGEFLNHHVLRYFQDRKQIVQFTRSRPYHSGDNAHVEQKNWTHVRQLFGYYRLSNPLIVPMMNDLYSNELSNLHNYFYPAMKLQDKQRIQSKIKKHYDKPQTPYQRLIASPHLSKKQKKKLKQKFLTLNPFELKASIERKLKKIFVFVNLTVRKKTTRI